MKVFRSIIVKGFSVLIFGTVFAAMLLILSFMLPVNSENREATYNTLSAESKPGGTYTRAATSGEYYENHYNSFLISDGLDNATDTVMLYTALDTSDGNPLERAMKCHNSIMNRDYSYYWHGYVSVLRPLLLMFNYVEIRMLNSALQLFITFLLIFFVAAKRGMRYALMALSSYILLMPMALSLSLQFSWIFYVSYGGTLVLILKKNYFEKNYRYLYFFMILGMAACYFDLLTYPLFAWGMPIVWWIVLDDRPQKEFLWLKEVVNSGIAWIIGYAGIWLMKWILGSAILKTNIFESAINEIFLRSGIAEGDGSWSDRINAIYLNWKHYEVKIFAVILAVWLIFWIGRTFFMGGWQKDSKRFAYLLIGVSSIVWYFLLSNHTRGHNYFTYRIYGVSILAFFAIVLGSIPSTACEKTIQPKRRLCLIFLFLFVCILSLPIPHFAREELHVINGAEQFQTISMLQGEQLEVSFSPTFNDIEEIRLGLQALNDTGFCKVSLWNGDKLLYSEQLDLSTFGESNFQQLKNAWHLNHEITYKLLIEIESATEPVYVWITENGSMPLTEYGDIYINGVKKDGQLLTGLTYWGMPALRSTRIFIIMTWIGILTVCAYVFLPSSINGKQGIFS